MSRARSSVGFTLSELLVVIVILAIVIGIAVPAFTSIQGGTERTMADNQLRVALSAGRDAAVRSEGGDAAAVFFFEPGGRVTVLPCVSVGVLDDQIYNGATPYAPTDPARARREVFVPITGVEPVSLPRGWSVRGYAPPGVISGTTGDAISGWYEWMSSLADEGGWVFPETNFLDPRQPTIGRQGYHRQTFMVRFKAGTGTLDAGDTRPVLVLAPLNTTSFRAAPPFAANRVDQIYDLSGYAKRLLGRPGQASIKWDLLGDRSADSVLARGVTELALYQESSLARGIRSRLNAVTGTVYADPTPNPGPGPDGPTIATESIPGGSNAIQTAQAITEWIEGRHTPAGATEPSVSDARILTVQRYLGQVQEVRP